MTTLQAHFRATTEKLDSIRQNGSIPAVFYGAGKPSTAISVPALAFQKAFKEAGESSTIRLTVEKDTLDVLIHDVQFDPVRHVPMHADFLVVDMNKPIEVTVPLEFVGTAPAVKNGLGVLTKVLHEVEVRGLPKDLPHQIEVDITSLETLENQIHVSNIVAPKGIEILTDGNDVIALVSAVKEEVEAEAAPVDLSAIEVEKKGKKEEEGVVTEPAAE